MSDFTIDVHKTACSFHDCDRARVVKGLCVSHYNQQRLGKQLTSLIPAIRTCSIAECEEKHWAKGWCRRHYRRWRKHGNPTHSKLNETIEDRFFKHCPQQPWGQECAVWTGRVNDDGYGVLTHSKRNHIASRVSFQIYNGPIPDGLLVRHKCDNPPCVNPLHLLVGSDADNSRDSVERKRHAFGEKQGSAKLTEAQVREIRGTGRSRTLKDLAGEFGVSFSTIARARKGESWSHVE